MGVRQMDFFLKEKQEKWGHKELRVKELEGEEEDSKKEED